MNEDYLPKKIVLTPGKPIQMLDESIEVLEPLPSNKQAEIKQIADTIKQYLDEAENLIKNKYNEAESLVPEHLKNPGIALVSFCNDGLIIRYDRKLEKKGIGIAIVEKEISEVAPLISENVIHCEYDIDSLNKKHGIGPEITMYKTDASTGHSIEISKVKIGFRSLIKKPVGSLPKPPQKPYCLLSVYNQLEINIIGELLDDATTMRKGRQFLIRSLIKLPVGWECVEIFPFFSTEGWKPEYAKVWAENDILKSIVRNQLREAKLNSLDPNAAARQQYAALLTSYKSLLDSHPDREEALQKFLAENPSILCPTFIRVWPKLALGNRVTDFVFKEASGDYLLVELEKSTHKLFLANGHTSRELNHARGQILDWKRYIEDNLATVQRELGLRDISSNPKGLIVIGRSSSLTASNRRKMVALENESPRLKILTYDDVLLNAKITIENFLGPLDGEMGNTEIYYLPQKWLSIEQS